MARVPAKCPGARYRSTAAAAQTGPPPPPSATGSPSLLLHRRAAIFYFVSLSLSVSTSSPAAVFVFACIKREKSVSPRSRRAAFSDHSPLISARAGGEAGRRAARGAPSQPGARRNDAPPTLTHCLLGARVTDALVYSPKAWPTPSRIALPPSNHRATRQPLASLLAVFGSTLTLTRIYRYATVPYNDAPNILI